MCVYVYVPMRIFREKKYVMPKRLEIMFFIIKKKHFDRTLNCMNGLKVTEMWPEKVGFAKHIFLDGHFVTTFRSPTM